jgi:sec-independent protein translocase protein TatC
MALVPFPSQAPDRPPEDETIHFDPYKREADDEDEGDAGGKMSFLEHLDELRKRIIRAIIAVFAGFLIACFFIQQLFDFIMKPLQQLLPPGGTLVYTDPTEAFVLYIKIAAIAGLFIASPAVMSQVWLFIAPGLYANEKKMAIPFVVMSSFFFIAGAAFSHYVVFPLTWKFFVSFTTDYLTFMPRVEPAFSLYMKMLLAFGLVFQMPTVVLFLAKMGVVTARFLWRNIKYAVLIIFIIAAVITPSADVITQTAMAGPMILLYLLSIALAWAFGKKKTVEEA